MIYAELAWTFVKRIAGRIPWEAWLAVIVIVLSLSAYLLHSGWIADAKAASYAQGVADATKKFTAAQDKLDKAVTKHVAETMTAQIAINKESIDALVHANTDIDARAADIRLRHEAAVARLRAAGASDQAAAGVVAIGPCHSPAQDGLAWDAAYPLIVRAAKNDAQLNAILDWEAQQEALDAKERAAVVK